MSDDNRGSDPGAWERWFFRGERTGPALKWGPVATSPAFAAPAWRDAPPVIPGKRVGRRTPPEPAE